MNWIAGPLEGNESWGVDVEKEDSNWMKSFNKENTAETNENTATNKHW